MIDFQKIDLSQAEQYRGYLAACGERGCEYSLTNLYIWGRQKVAFLHDCLALFSQFQRKSVYPFPIGDGDVGSVLDGEQAVREGLIDGVGGLKEALGALKEMIEKEDQSRYNKDYDENN